ncbi:MAG: MFS transporter [Actinomycetota bacterium]|nr:MFS transporter [Actinomycetota bacterium]
MKRVDLAPLKVREFRILLFSSATSVFGDGITSVALVFAVLDATGSVSDVGLVLSCRVFPQVVLLLMGGVIADRGRRDRVMALSQLASGLCESALACLLLLGDAKLWALALAYMGMGCAQATFKPASSGLVRQLMPTRDLPAANGLMSMAQSTGLIIGPAVGGIIAAAGSPGMAIGIDASTFLASAFLLGRLKIALPYATRSPQGLLRGLRDGWGVVRSRRWLWAMIGFFSVFQFTVLGGLYVLGPAVARARLGGAAAWGLMLAASGVGSLLGGGLALRWRPRRLLVGANASVLGVVPAFVALSAAAPAAVGVAAMALYGLSLAYGETLWESALQANVPADKLSRVAAYDWLGSTALRPLGLALAGPIAAAIGTDAELLAIAAAVVLGVTVLLAVPDVRQVGLDTGAAAVAVAAAKGGT